MSQIFYVHVLVQQSFTSNWPKNLWLAVDQRGVHLLEARSRNVLTTYEYESLVDFTPSLNHMLIITGTDKKQSKIIVNTNQVRRKPENRNDVNFGIQFGFIV